jgi:hypothetical protein
VILSCRVVILGPEALEFDDEDKITEYQL